MWKPVTALVFGCWGLEVDKGLLVPCPLVVGVGGI